MKKTHIFAAAAVALAMALVAATAAGCANEAATAGAKTNTQRVTRGNLVLGLGADGRVALPVSNLNFGVTGVVSKVYVSVGDTVKAGDLLAELDDSDYQFAISSANNNLTKSQTAYDNAVSQYNLSVLSDEKDLNKLQRTINSGFDDYTYQNAITDARLTLERRTDDLSKATAKAESPFDPYTYDNQIADAERTQAARQKEYDEAESALLATFDDYTYQNAITDAKTNLERKKAALADAEKEASTFDSYQYDNAISAALLNMSRREAEYRAAEDEYFAAVSSDTNVASVNTRLTAARSAYEDSIRAHTNATTDLQRAKAANATAGATKVDNAKLAVDDAQRQLDKATTDMERAASQSADNKTKSFEAAKDALGIATSSLEKIKKDKERAKSQAEQDAADQLRIAIQSVSDAQANLDKAMTNLARARSDYNTQIQDTKVDLQLKQISADMNKNSNASISNAEFALEEAKLKLEEAKKNLDKVKLYASIDGQVLSVSRKPGESVAAQNDSPGALFFGTGGSGNSFITLCDTTKIYLTANITEGDIVSVKKDQVIQVRIDAIGDDIFYGSVTNVDSIPTTDANGITTYTVTCLLLETSNVIKDGMNAYITFVRRENKNVLLIPNKAVFMENELQYVNVVRSDGTYEKRKVVCGLSNGVQTEAVSGLEEGETVLVGRIS